MSISSRRKHSIELASFHAAFLADDTLVTIVPTFDYADRIPLLSASAVGPLKAGIATHVPLWLAMLLQQRSLCTLQVPEWLDTEHLTQVKHYETTEQRLTPSQDDTAAAIDTSTTSTTPTLPFYYAQIGQRFTSSSTATSTNTNTNTKASNLVLQDIQQIRLDKLRQQFQQVSQHEMHNPNLCLAVTGIASAELVQLKPLIQQALNDQRFLATTSLTADATKNNNNNNNNNNINKTSRPKTVADMSQDDDETTSAGAGRSGNALRSRIRRFRG